MKYLIFIILLIGCNRKDFTPLVEPVSGVTIAQGNGFLVRMVVLSNNDTSYMIFYDRVIETDLTKLYNSPLKIDGQQGSILYMQKFDASMMADLEQIK
jgi:hypothetical protein